MNLEEYKGVFVFAQQVDNEISGIAFELIGKGKDLAKDLNTEVTAVLIGSGVKGLADELAAYGADRVIVVDDPELKDYRTEPYTHALASVINQYKPEIMLIGATAIGRDLGPRVSARVATGLTADCTQLDIGDFPLVAREGQEQKHNQLLMTRPAFGGNTIATIACPDNRPQMATVRPGVMQKIDRIEGAKAVVEEYNPGFTPDNKYVEILDVVKVHHRYCGHHGCQDPGIRRPRHGLPGKLRDAQRAGRCIGRRSELLPRCGRRRLGTEGSAGGPDRQNRAPAGVLCHRYFRRYPARGWHGGI